MSKFHVIHLWLGQHDVLRDPNNVWCNPHTVSWPTQWAVWHGGLGRPGSAGIAYEAFCIHFCMRMSMIQVHFQVQKDECFWTS